MKTQKFKLNVLNVIESRKFKLDVLNVIELSLNQA